ncbi:MAG: hypothetical protein V4662_00800 [Verrucomicrobiota bacterium]
MLTSGCQQDGMVVTKTKDGMTTPSTYSKFYDEGVWLIPDKLGFVLAIDHGKQVPPVVHGAAQSLGALGPGDSVAEGKATLYLWNFDSTAYAVTYHQLLVPMGSLPFKGQVVEAPPHKRTGVEAGKVQLFNYGTEISCQVALEVEGRRMAVNLTLPRRKQDELPRLYGKNGVPPYPWGKRDL